MEKIGKRIRKARELLEFTQEELGEKVGVTKAAVSGWERGGGNRMKLLVFYELLRVLKMRDNGRWLIFGDKGPPPPRQ
jgi:transcriptional regulator with XRE-family HTH domain